MRYYLWLKLKLEDAARWIRKMWGRENVKA